MTSHDSTIVVDIDERVSVPRSIMLALQHVLAMDIYIVPIILAGILAMEVGETSTLVQMTLVASGIATILQVTIGTRLPVVQGPSYIPIGALAAIGGGFGLATMIGSLIPGALLITALGFIKAVGKAIRWLIPPIVAGTVILVIGISLMPVALGNIYAAGEGGAGGELVVAFSTAGLLVALLVLGARATRALKILKVCSVLLAIAGGTVLAGFYGMVDFSAVGEASWIALPGIFQYGPPQFEWSAVLTLAVIYLIVLVESTGTWFAVGGVTGRKITDRVITGGVRAEGLGCVVAPVIGGMPVTGYATNAGVIAITGVASKRVIIFTGGILVALGLVPKFSTLIASIPEVVIMGAFSIVTVIIAMNGVKVLGPVTMSERNMLVIGVPILVTLAASAMPASVKETLPTMLQYLIEGGMALGAVAALVLNLILPRDTTAAAAAGADTDTDTLPGPDQAPE